MFDAPSVDLCGEPRPACTNQRNKADFIEDVDIRRKACVPKVRRQGERKLLVYDFERRKAIRGWQAKETGIELTRQKTTRLLRGRKIAQRNGDSGMLLPKVSDELRHNRQYGQADPETQMAMPPAACFTCAQQDFIRVAHERLRISQERLAEWRELRTVPTALEQPATEARLQCADLLA